MRDKEKLEGYLDQFPHYSNFLLFFQREIEEKGVKETLEEHVFANSEHANRIFVRVFCSIFHSYIHLGYALEYSQPAIVAEALAMACVHDPEADKIAPIFLKSERLAGGPTQPGNRSLFESMNEVRDNKTLKGSFDGNNKGDRCKNVADNAMEEMVTYAAQYSISRDQLQERLDEMIDTCSLLIAAKPAQAKEGQRYKIDFFLLHSVNTLVMMPSFVNHEWISLDNGIRVIEWAGRCHLLTYVSRTSPPITPVEINKYPIKRSWHEIFNYSINHPSDDGHLQKCVRSLAFGEKMISKKFDKNSHKLKPDVWLRLANLVVDSVPYEAKTPLERWLIVFQASDVKT